MWLAVKDEECCTLEDSMYISVYHVHCKWPSLRVRGIKTTLKPIKSTIRNLRASIRSLWPGESTKLSTRSIRDWDGTRQLNQYNKVSDFIRADPIKRKANAVTGDVFIQRSWITCSAVHMLLRERSSTKQPGDLHFSTVAICLDPTVRSHLSSRRAGRCGDCCGNTTRL